MKNWFKTLLAGIGIGISSAIPGVSGGTIAVILKVYEKILWAVSNLFKQFKRAVIILIPILIGLVIGIIPTIILMNMALSGFLFGVICIFAGFIIGSLPEITNEVKDEKPKKIHIITLIIAFVIATGLGILSIVVKADVSQHFVQPEWWFYIILIPVGVIASIALVVPGISGGMLLILIGFYAPLINSTVDTFEAAIKANDWSHMGIQCGILICFAIGVIVGFFVVSKVMNYFLTKYRKITFYGILGFIFGSLVSLFVNLDIYNYYQMWAQGGQGLIQKEIEIPLGIVLLIICALISILFLKYIEKKNQKEELTN